ncbi:hypothetical protein CDD83_8609 [Cordyceps sp. RAO-2017]|nr:hypothetical protein CDD83_8609 [Cordyceps sp. RAO-2017]
MSASRQGAQQLEWLMAQPSSHHELPTSGDEPIPSSTAPFALLSILIAIDRRLASPDKARQAPSRCHTGAASAAISRPQAPTVVDEPCPRTDRQP